MTSIHIPPQRLNQLRDAAGSGPVLILTHDNPDPDGLASGQALAYLLSHWGIECKLLYAGIILRSENKTMHALLTPRWELVLKVEDIKQYSAIATLDTQPGAGNNSLLEVDQAQIVIDHHHPIRDGIGDVPFADLRPEMGATSSMLMQYLVTAQVEIPPDLATALFYGLKTDTRSLSRGASKIDEDAYMLLLELLDRSKLVRIEQASLPRYFYRALAGALANTMLYGDVLIANLGEMYRPDFGAEIADLLIRLDNAKAALCLGVYEQTLYLSLRTIPMGIDAGNFIQKIIYPPGKAGGHGTMAGGQFPIGSDQDKLRRIQDFSQRFLTIMGVSPLGTSLLNEAGLEDLLSGLAPA